MSVLVPSRHALVLAFAIWSALLVLFLWREFHVLRLHETWATFSYFVRVVRFSLVGRFVILMTWCWLTEHFVLAPRWLGVEPNNWRTAVALGVGFGWALCETFGWLGMRR